MLIYLLTVCTSAPLITVGTGTSSPVGPFNTGQTVTYTCGGNQNLVGSTTLTCMADGTFSGPAPMCVEGKT